MSAELSAVIAVSVVSAALFYTAFQFNKTEDIFIGHLGQLFHGLAMGTLLVLLGVASNVAPASVTSLMNGLLIVLTVVVVLYILLMTSRAIIYLVVDGYEWFTKKIRGRNY